MVLKRLVDRKTEELALRPANTVMEALERMLHLKIGAIVVVSDTGRVIGIFTKRDLLGRVVTRHLSPAETPLGDVMTTEVVTVNQEVSVGDAIRLMSEFEIRHLPIVKDEEVFTGLVSLQLLLTNQIQGLREYAQSLEGFLNDAPGG